MSEPFLAEITMFGGNFAPRGWSYCNGALLSISQNTALFALLGTTYGGNGQSTFGLPNLQGRLPVHPGQGPGLSPYSLGETDGAPSVTLLTSEMPAHIHPLFPVGAAAGVPASANPSGNAPAGPAAGNFYAEAGGALMAAGQPGSLSTVGGSQAHTNLMPGLAISFIIAVEGIFPSRN